MREVPCIYEVYRTRTFNKMIKRLSPDEQKKITNIELQLKKNPFTGKPLGYRFFREKKIKDKRIYYLIYEDFNIVLLVAISDKKAQQTTINKIKELLPAYYEGVKKFLKPD